MKKWQILFKYSVALLIFAMLLPGCSSDDDDDTLPPADIAIFASDLIANQTRNDTEPIALSNIAFRDDQVLVAVPTPGPSSP